MLYTFHRANPLSLRRLIRLHRANPQVTVVPCLGIRQRIHLPALVDLQPAPAKFFSWVFLRSTHCFELSRTINRNVESVRRKAEIGVVRDALHRIGLKLYCDFTPLGYFNQDLAILNWFSSEGKNLDFDFLVFFEYDMFATKTIEGLYGKYTRYDAGFVNYHEAHPLWYWYRNPPGAKKSIIRWLKQRNSSPILYGGLFPGHIVSREVLTTLEKAQLPYGFCEIRLPSVLTGLGFSCVRLNFPLVRYGVPLSKSDVEANSSLGLFHPVYDILKGDARAS